MVDRIATSKDVAAALHISPATVQWHARKGNIPFDRTPGGHRRYDIAEIQMALEPESDDIAAELTPLVGAQLGRGVPTPDSADARMTRALRSARPEPRPAVQVQDVLPKAPSALQDLVAHARHVTLTTLSS